MRIVLLWIDRIWMRPPWLQTARYLSSTMFHFCRVRQVHRRLLLPSIQLNGGIWQESHLPAALQLGISNKCGQAPSAHTGWDPVWENVPKGPPPVQNSTNLIEASPDLLHPRVDLGTNQSPKISGDTWTCPSNLTELRRIWREDIPPNPDNPSKPAYKSWGDRPRGRTLIHPCDLWGLPAFLSYCKCTPDPGVKNTVLSIRKRRRREKKKISKCQHKSRGLQNDDRRRARGGFLHFADFHPQ